MPSTTRLFALAALLVSVTALVPPGLQGPPNQVPANTTAPTTDSNLIAQTAGEVSQKSSGPVDAPPNAAVPPTAVTALDRAIVNTSIAGASTTRRREIDIGRSSFLRATTALVPPGLQGSPNQAPANTTAPTTDSNLIAQTAGEVSQKSSGPVDAPPNAAVPPTAVTALDGAIVNTTIAGASTSTTRRREIDIARFGKRQTVEYVEIFAPLAAGVHDASIEGTAYLTYTVVSNATYNIDDCLAFCDTVDGCEFVNLYYEFNNYLLDSSSPSSQTSSARHTATSITPPKRPTLADRRPTLRSETRRSPSRSSRRAAAGRPRSSPIPPRPTGTSSSLVLRAGRITLLGTWASHSLTIMTSTPAPPFAMAAASTLGAAPASTSIFGVRSSTASPRLIPAPCTTSPPTSPPR